MGDNSQAVLLQPDEDGRFRVQLYADIAGTRSPLTISGRVTAEYDAQMRPIGVIITLDAMPVPLDIGIAFREIQVSPETPSQQGGVNTGDPSNPWLWAFLLTASGFALWQLLKKRLRAK